MEGRRVFFDISFTRTQSGTVGISRTVRKLLGELDRQHCSPIPVAFHSSGFRLVNADRIAPPEAARRERRLLNLVQGRLFRQVVSLALRLPWALLSRSWAFASTRIFNGMSRDASPVTFRSGDVLFMCDASWNYAAWVPVQHARDQGAKVVLLVYDLIPIHHPQFCFRLTTLVFEHWLRKMVPRSDAVIGISRATQEELSKWISKFGVQAPPLGYFHLGADLECSTEATPRLRNFFAGGAPTFVSVGTVEPRKNHVQLLDVFDRLWAAGSNARWLIVGKPTIDCEQVVLRLHRHRENGRRLMTIADASDGEIRYAYTQCRALVFPSLAEGFGLPLVEARACECRVIASDLPVFREFADEGVTFFSAGSADALEAALRSELAKPSDRYKPVAKLPSWADSGAEFVNVARRLLAN